MKKGKNSPKISRRKLLVADDSLTIQKVIQLALSNEGYEIQVLSDGNDGVEKISTFRPEIVLVDVSLPGKSAFELKEQVNSLEDLKNVKFVLMSSAFISVDEAKVKELKFDARLTKPFDPAHLREALEGARPFEDEETARDAAFDSTQRVSPENTHDSSHYQPREFTEDDLDTSPAEDLPPIEIEEPGELSVPEFTNVNIGKSLDREFTKEFRTKTPVPPPFKPKEDAGIDIEKFTSSSFEMNSSTHDFGVPQTEDWKREEDYSGGVQDYSSNNISGDEFRNPPTLSEIMQAEGGGAIGKQEIEITEEPEQFLESKPGPDSDIRMLTESTVHMSGLDNYQWNVNEAARKEGGMDKVANFIKHGAGGFDSDNLASNVQNELQRAIMPIVQKLLPEIAEKIIKGEIRKLLTESEKDN